MMERAARPTRPRPKRDTLLENDPVLNVRAPEGGFQRPKKIPSLADLDKAQNERRRLLFKQARVRDMGHR